MPVSNGLMLVAGPSASAPGPEPGTTVKSSPTPFAVGAPGVAAAGGTCCCAFAGGAMNVVRPGRFGFARRVRTPGRAGRAFGEGCVGSGSGPGGGAGGVGVGC